MLKKYLKHFGHLLVFAIFCLAIYLLYHKLKQYSLEQISDSLSQISSWRLWVCFLATIGSYIILVGYDWLAIKAIHKSLPLPKVCLVSFVGQAVSYNFGALLGGTAVRYRLYSTWNFSVTEIVKLVLMLAVTFWVGVLGMCGLFFMVSPPHIPEQLVEHLPFANLQILGAILFLIAAAYMCACFVVRKSVHLFGKEFSFPPPKLAVAQLIVASVDIVAAAFCMYILLPGHLNVSFGEFIPSYLLAQVAVVLTHVPGGVGIFELIIIHLTQTDQTQVVFAAVLLFRLIYYILPLLLAALIFAGYELSSNRSFFKDLGRRLKISVNYIGATLATLIGFFYLISAYLPTPLATYTAFEANYGSGLAFIGQILTGLAGIIIIYLAYGLKLRQARALQGVLFCLTLGFAGAALNCLSLITLGVSLVAFLIFWLWQKRFYRKSFFLYDRTPMLWLTFVLILGAVCPKIVDFILLADSHLFGFFTYVSLDAAWRSLAMLGAGYIGLAALGFYGVCKSPKTTH